MPVWECPIAMAPFDRAWKAGARFASDGIPRAMCFSDGCFCGRILRRGTGWGGRNTVEGSMRSLVVTITIGAVFFAASCGDDKPIASSITNAAPAPSLPTSNGASAAEAGDTSLIVSGPIIVDHQVELAAQRDGVVEKVLFDAPARVRSGTILAFLDGRQVEANLAAAQAKSRSIAADLKNWQSE